MLSEWFNAHDAYHKASEEYNKRVELVRQERERGNHTMNVNEEYRQLHAAQHRALRADENLWAQMHKIHEKARLSPPEALDAYKEMFEIWRHKKRGTTYTTHNRDATLQCTDNNPPVDGERMVVYVSTSDGKEYVRPHREFFDGRFEKISNAEPTDLAD